MAADVKIAPSPHPQSHPRGQGGIFSIAESAGPAEHPATVISTSAPSVPQTMMASDAETFTLPSEDADGNLLARHATSVTQQSARPISHLCYSSYTHTTRTQAGASTPILRVHLKKLMCMEKIAAGGDPELSTARVRDGDLLAFPTTSVIQRSVRPITHLFSSFFTHTTCTQAGALTPILSVHLKKLMCMERETEGVDSVRLAVRVYSLVWGEEGIMQDGGFCPERGMGTVGSLPDGYD